MSHPLISSQTVLRAQIAAHTSWANTGDRSARTQPARKAAQKRFEREVDPDGVLDPDERARRAENARKAHLYSMALKSAKVRRLRAEAETLQAEVNDFQSWLVKQSEVGK